MAGSFADALADAFDLQHEPFLDAFVQEAAFVQAAFSVVVVVAVVLLTVFTSTAGVASVDEVLAAAAFDLQHEPFSFALVQEAALVQDALSLATVLTSAFSLAALAACGQVV